MTVTRVKICGNRNARDLRMAVDHGADAVGLIVGTRFVSEDGVSPRQAGELISRLPPFVSSVMVTHLQGVEEIVDACRTVLSTTLQLHNDVALADVASIRRCLPGVKLIKAIHVTGSEAIGAAQDFAELMDAILLDSRTGNRIGGTGMVHDWSISRRIVRTCPRPVILAGGLRPENVQEAIAMVQPHGVDVNSGVDDPHGDKDPLRLVAFMARCRAGSSTVE